MAVCALFTANSIANPTESQLLFSLTSDNKARVGIINTSNGNLFLEIVNKEGQGYFDVTAKKGTNYFKLLDLSKLPDGEYTIRLKGLPQEMHRKFSISNNKITLKREVKPVFKIMDNDKFLIYYGNSEKNPVSIIFSQNNELIFENKELTDATISVTYSLKNLPEGTYTVSVITADDTYKYELKVN